MTASCSRLAPAVAISSARVSAALIPAAARRILCSMCLFRRMASIRSVAAGGMGPAGGFPPGSSHTGTINFNGNTENFNFTVTWLPAGIFVIEAEDFDSTDPATGITTHNPGATIPGTDTDYIPALMPYLGGAFAG